MSSWGATTQGGRCVVQCAGTGSLMKGRHSPVSFIEIEVSTDGGQQWTPVPWDAVRFSMSESTTLSFRAVVTIGGMSACATDCEVVSLPIRSPHVAHTWTLLFTWNDASASSSPPGIAVEIQLLKEMERG